VAVPAPRGLLELSIKPCEEALAGGFLQFAVGVDSGKQLGVEIDYEAPHEECLDEKSTQCPLLLEKTADEVESALSCDAPCRGVAADHLHGTSRSVKEESHHQHEAESTVGFSE
jgi:hypothetical protein